MTELLAAFLLGLVSAGHCLGMCGGLVVAAGIQAQSAIYAALYNVGRIGSYLTLAFVVGLLSSRLPESVFPVLKLLSAGLLLLTALYLVGLNRWITKIEIIGTPIWKISQPLAQRILPIRRPGSALLLGYFWGFIPCGLVYTALTFSLAQPGLGLTVLSMAAFGLGTFPAMMGAALLAASLRQFLAKTRVRAGLAVMMLGMATVIIVQVLTQLR